MASACLVWCCEVLFSYLGAEHGNLAAKHKGEPSACHGHCNSLALAAGYAVEVEVEEESEEVWAGDVGHFWPQIVEVYMLLGHVLLGNGQRADAKAMYAAAHALASRVKSRAARTQLAICAALENLAVVAMHEQALGECLGYTRAMLAVLRQLGDAVPNAPMKLLNARAYHACCLELELKGEGEGEGEAQLQRVLDDASARFGASDARTLGFYCYFALHLVQTRAWRRAHVLLAHILAHCRSGPASAARKVGYIDAVCELLSEYMAAAMAKADGEAGLKSAGEARQLQWLKEQAATLHEEQLAMANELNRRHLEQVLRRHSSRHQQDQDGGGDDDEDELEIIELREADKAPKVDVVALLARHIRLFVFVGDVESAHCVVTECMDRHRRLKHGALLAQYLKLVPLDELQHSPQCRAVAALYDEVLRLKRRRLRNDK